TRPGTCPLWRWTTARDRSPTFAICLRDPARIHTQRSPTGEFARRLPLRNPRRTHYHHPHSLSTKHKQRAPSSSLALAAFRITGHCPWTVVPWAVDYFLSSTAFFASSRTCSISASWTSPDALLSAESPATSGSTTSLLPPELCDVFSSPEVNCLSCD